LHRFRASSIAGSQATSAGLVDGVMLHTTAKAHITSNGDERHSMKPSCKIFSVYPAATKDLCIFIGTMDGKA